MYKNTRTLGLGLDSFVEQQVGLRPEHLNQRRVLDIPIADPQPALAAREAVGAVVPLVAAARVAHHSPERIFVHRRRVRRGRGVHEEAGHGKGSGEGHEGGGLDEAPAAAAGNR